MRVESSDVYRRARKFDLIHNNVDYLAFPFDRRTGATTITTIHPRLDLRETQRLYRAFPEDPLLSISDNQRTYMPGANWIATVPNGIDLSKFHVREDSGDYLFFRGQISPEKRPDRAMAIAREAGMRLVIAAKIDDVDRTYYEHTIAPLIRANHNAEYIREVDERGKDELLGGTYSYLFPIDWPEPFGLPMVEAMATGTPVIAYRAGSVPEVVVDGVTRFICNTGRAMVDAISCVPQLDRSICRRHVEQHFSIGAMLDGYERVYARSVEHGWVLNKTNTLVGTS